MVRLPGPYAGLKIGLLGGSFNPAHAGHMHVAETASRTLGLDWVWWIVARGNPLKTSLGDHAKRLASAREFTRSHPRMRVTDIEDTLGITYSVDLIEALKTRAPSANFVWLMGGDSLANFHLWKNWRAIAEAVPIAAVARPGSEVAALNAPFALAMKAHRLPLSAVRALPGAETPAWAYLPAKLNPLSSTELRK